MRRWHLSPINGRGSLASLRRCIARLPAWNSVCGLQGCLGCSSRRRGLCLLTGRCLCLRWDACKQLLSLYLPESLEHLLPERRQPML